MRRPVGGLLALTAAMAIAPGAGAVIPDDDCARRIIRDWSSAGSVDDGYPLACYRAALHALPEDVLRYSNADEEIRHALALARRSRAAGKSSSRAEATTRANRAAPSSASPAAPAIVSTSPARAAFPHPITALTALALGFLGVAAVGWAARRRSARR